MDEETRAQYEGFRPGVYVRVQVDDIPAEFVTHFDPMYPIVLGALLSAEQNIGYVQVSSLQVRKAIEERIHPFTKLTEFML